jgi:hypothetical protein
MIVARHLSSMISTLGTVPKEVEVSAKRGPVGARPGHAHQILRIRRQRL